MKIINNIQETFSDDLKRELKAGSKLAMAASCFSIYAYEELREELEKVDSLRFIFTSPTFTTERLSKEIREFYIPRLARERSLYGTEFEIRLRNELSQKAVARECAEWIRRKVRFKSNMTDGGMPSLLHFDDMVYTPVDGFTTVTLGSEKGNNISTMINRMEYPMAGEYLKMFDQIWNNDEKMEDVTEQVIENISNAYKENAPEFIYFVTLYNIFHEFLEDLDEDHLVNDATGFKESEIWNILYNFQRDAALGIISKLEKYNGCILADSVGLGKTFTSLAVMKYYESRNKTVLVLCPKKLYNNWDTYRQPYKNNPLAADRMNYRIVYHTDLSREGGTTGGLDLAKLNWGNFDLVVIDESHNFRNGGRVREDDEGRKKMNRYSVLMDKVIRNGVKTKVLMLSATPVNNRFNDLKNQLQLAYEGDSENINDLLPTERGVEEIFTQAQKAYNLWARRPPEGRTAQSLLDALDYDFFKLLDAVTIARSRKHIKQYYDTKQIGSFPKRLPPVNRRPKLTDVDNAISFDEIFDELCSLNLSVYAPSSFILPSRMFKYMDKGDDAGGRRLTISEREQGIQRLMNIQLLKRLESSVNSFRLTLERIKKLIDSMLERIEMFERGEMALSVEEYGDFDLNDDYEELYVGKKKNRILLEDMDYITWRKRLRADNVEIELILTMLSTITPEHDSKLICLGDELVEKMAEPINPNNRKVIIFTAFSDTAEYLYENIAPKIKQEFGLYTALVTGSGNPKTNHPMKTRKDFNTILTLFSPCSKDARALIPNMKHEIDILIATDCISEGQNLQDCDYLINYDIHWNPVRIIQRFGRIDRIGSKNNVIQLVNYWPNVELDEYINLKSRVEARMKAGVMVATGDDNPLSPEEKYDLSYRRKQLKRLQEEVVDLEEMDTGVNIMDLGLNEFRLDLLEYINSGNDVEHTPFGIHAVTRGREFSEPGVIFVLRNRNDGVNIDHRNQLHPFYMVYISDRGKVKFDHLHPKELLDHMRVLCKGRKEHDVELCAEFNRQTHDGLRMEQYSELLDLAVESIVGVSEQSELDSFLGGVAADLFSGYDVKGLDDFELICFLVIK